MYKRYESHHLSVLPCEGQCILYAYGLNDCIIWKITPELGPALILVGVLSRLFLKIQREKSVDVVGHQSRSKDTSSNKIISLVDKMSDNSLVDKIYMFYVINTLVNKKDINL